MEVDKTIYVVFLIFLGLLIVVSNLILICTITIIKRFRIVSNLYILSLSLSDLLVGIFVIAALTVSIMEIPMPLDWCTVSPIIELFTFSGGIFTIVCMSFDRYRAAVKPTTYHPTVKSTTAVIVCTWIAAFVYSLRIFLQFTITDIIRQGTQTNDQMTSSESEDNATSAEETVFCNILHEDDEYDFIFRSMDFVLLFLAPLVAVAVMYRKVIVILWSMHTTNSENLKKKRALIKMLVLTIVAFFLCWIPFYLLDIIDDLLELIQNDEGGDNEGDESASSRVRWFLIIFALSHSIIHPSLYTYFNIMFRKEMSRIFSRVFHRNHQVHPQPSVDTHETCLHNKSDAGQAENNHS